MKGQYNGGWGDWKTPEIVREMNFSDSQAEKSEFEGDKRFFKEWSKELAGELQLRL